MIIIYIYIHLCVYMYTYVYIYIHPGGLRYLRTTCIYLHAGKPYHVHTNRKMHFYRHTNRCYSAMIYEVSQVVQRKYLWCCFANAENVLPIYAQSSSMEA